MNNQMPYGFMPNVNGVNVSQNNELRILNERVDMLEKRVRKLEKKISMLENNNYPMPYNSNFNTQEYPNNYMI